jgi:hypothetical protein
MYRSGVGLDYRGCGNLRRDMPLRSPGRAPSIDVSIGPAFLPANTLPLPGAGTGATGTLVVQVPGEVAGGLQ